MNSFLVVRAEDVQLSSNMLEEHRKHLNLVIETTIKEGIIVSEKKAVVEKEKIEFLVLK